MITEIKLLSMLKKGDKILLYDNAGTEVNVNGEELLIMKESEIYGYCRII